MAARVSTSVKEVSRSLYRLLLHPSDAKLDGELYYEDDAWLFRDKGLDLQDFAPSFIDVYQYATRQSDENDDSVLTAMKREPEFQVFVYSFSYLPDPTWLVNWENGSSVDDWFEGGMVRLHEKSKNLELDMGEYLTGAVTELAEVEEGGDADLHIVSFTTNKNRDLVINKCSKSMTQYRVQLPDGFGIVGRFPAPRSSFGFYVGWMTPKQWSVRNHFWFPNSFRQTVQTLLLTFNRLAKTHSHTTASATKEAPSSDVPSSVMQLIVQRVSLYEAEPPSEEMKGTHWKFIQELSNP